MKRIQFWGENLDDDRLVRQIISKQKTATACPAQTYYLNQGEYDDGGFEVGDLVEVYDLNCRPRCVIRITEYYTTTFGDIPEKLWKGECNTSAEEFQTEHISCWPDLNITDDFLIAFNHFEMVRIINFE